MNREEATKILAVLKANYPHAYKGITKEEALGMVNLWQTMFEREPYSIVSAGVMAFIATDTKGFPPVVGQVKEQIQKLKDPDGMTEMEAWELVRKAICNSAYKSREEFEKLPPMLQKLVGSPSALYRWSQTDMSEVQTVVASNFMRSYRARRQTEKEQAVLPPKVASIMQKIGECSVNLLKEGAAN